MITTWEDIPGFFDFADIYDQAVFEAKDESQFVEVGAFLGKSAAYMVNAILESRKRIYLTVVDNWEPDRESNWWERINNNPPTPWPVPELFGMTRFDAFKRCMSSVGALGKMNTLRDDSVNAAKMYRDGSLNLVFIDADHRAPAPALDIAAWTPKVKPGGILAGHDYDVPLWPDVKRAVDEAFGSRVERRGTSWMVRM